MLAAAFGLATPALAQGVDSGLEVRVNPYAAAGGSRTLLYPGGQYSRSVPPLLYPGQAGGPIRLHMPSKHRRVASAEPVAKPKPKPVKVAKSEAPPAPQPSADTSSPFLGNTPNLSNVFGAPPKAPPPKKLASAAPPPAGAEAGLTKRSVILFAKDAADPAEGALKSIGFLANDLNAAMTGPGSRVELQAYGGTHGDKGSDARRLSLKRALAIRQILIDDGVSPDRIDVRAMGGTDDSGPADRVDVYVRA